jgi:TetR/AcrR family transcriptional repressor of nem operon
MDAAEQRIRLGGFNGFSFREIAADVGVKSSTVHYYFPTKEMLAAAVVRRYTDRLAGKIDTELAKGADPSEVLANAFRRTSHSETCMCPVVVMGAASGDLPTEVLTEVRRFYRMCLEKLMARGGSQKEAAETLSIITGAMVVANALNDKALYDRATAETVKTSPAGGRSGPRVSADARRPAARSSHRAAS